MDWSTYSARRKVTLSQFIGDAEDEAAAHKIFVDREVTPPSEEIAAFFEEKRLQAAAEISSSKNSKAEMAASATTDQQ